MSNPITKQRVLFNRLTKKALTARFDQQQAKIEYSYREIFQQRMFGIACGYVDGNVAQGWPMIRSSSYWRDATR